MEKISYKAELSDIKTIAITLKLAHEKRVIMDDIGKVEYLNCRSLLTKMFKKIHTHYMSGPAKNISLSLNVNEFMSASSLFRDSGLYAETGDPLTRVVVREFYEQCYNQLEELVQRDVEFSNQFLSA